MNGGRQGESSGDVARQAGNPQPERREGLASVESRIEGRFRESVLLAPLAFCRSRFRLPSGCFLGGLFPKRVGIQ